MKSVAFLVVFIAISEARLNERVEETIKSRLAELGSFEKDKEEIVGNFSKEIIANNARLEEDILEIKNNGRIQVDHIYQNMKIEKYQDIREEKKASNYLKNTEENVKRIHDQMNLLREDSTARVMIFEVEVDNNVQLLYNKILASAGKGFAKGKSLSQDIALRMKSFSNSIQFEINSFYMNIQVLVDRRHERCLTQIRTLGSRVGDYTEKSKNALSILDKPLQDSSLLEINLLMVDSNTLIEEAINDLNEKSSQIEKTFLNEVCNFEEEIDKGNQLVKRIKALVEELVGELRILVLDPVNMEIAQEFGISAEARKAPRFRNSLDKSSLSEKGSIGIGNGSIVTLNRLINCDLQFAYNQVIDHGAVGGVFHYSEEYFKPTTNTTEGFKYTLDLNDPNAILQIQATRKNTIDGFKYSLDLVDPNATPLFFETSRAGSSNICFFLLYIILTVIFYV